RPRQTRGDPAFQERLWEASVARRRPEPPKAARRQAPQPLRVLFVVGPEPGPATNTRRIALRKDVHPRTKGWRQRRAPTDRVGGGHGQSRQGFRRAETHVRAGPHSRGATGKTRPSPRTALHVAPPQSSGL